jgi:acyl-[acyl-carrier-protein]-phospholipid O-acyltransferase / long-chain-fatty-acid--[acyl-carrier-protein] ligase
VLNRLITDRKFWPLFTTQFLGSFNDNLFKNALVVLALFRLSAHAGAVLVALSGGLFLLPYALVSSVAGQLADAHEKSRTIIWIKFWELGLMCLALAGFLTGSIPLLLAVLLGLGLQAAFFSPLKYGILPDFFQKEALIEANGLVEAGTFGGIILGTLAGGVLFVLPHGPVLVPLAGICVSLTGIIAAFAIPKVPAAAPGLRIGWNLWAGTTELLRLARAEKPVWFACLAISWFGALGATVLAAFPTLARDVLHADSHVVTLLLGIFALGVGLGSLIAARAVHDSRLLRLTVPAGLGISLFTADLAWTALHMGTALGVRSLLGHWAGWRFCLDLGLLAICGGMFSVPFYVLLQEKSPVTHRARMVGANNVVNAIATVAAGGLAALAYAFGMGAPAVLLITAGLNLLVTFWILLRR